MRKVLASVFLVLAVLLPALAFCENPVYIKTSSIATTGATRIPAAGNFQYKSVDFSVNTCDFLNNDATNTVYVDITGATAVTDGSTTTAIPVPALTSLHIQGCTAASVSARASGGAVSLTVLVYRGAK